MKPLEKQLFANNNYQIEYICKNEVSILVRIYYIIAKAPFTIRNVGNVMLYFDKEPGSGEKAPHWNGKAFIFAEHFNPELIDALTEEINRVVKPLPLLIEYYKTDWSGSTYREIGRVNLRSIDD